MQTSARQLQTLPHADTGLPPTCAKAWLLRSTFNCPAAEWADEARFGVPAYGAGCRGPLLQAGMWSNVASEEGIETSTCSMESNRLRAAR